MFSFFSTDIGLYSIIPCPKRKQLSQTSRIVPSTFVLNILEVSFPQIVHSILIPYIDDFDKIRMFSYFNMCRLR